MTSNNYPLVEFIDRGLQSLYTKLGINYQNDNGVGLFAAFCALNGFDDDNIPMDLDPSEKQESTLLDFDPDFPFDGSVCDRNEHIFDLLYGLYQQHCINEDKKIKVRVEGVYNLSVSTTCSNCTFLDEALVSSLPQFVHLHSRQSPHAQQNHTYHSRIAHRITINK